MFRSSKLQKFSCSWLMQFRQHGFPCRQFCAQSGVDGEQAPSPRIPRRFLRKLKEKGLSADNIDFTFVNDKKTAESDSTSKLGSATHDDGGEKMPGRSDIKREQLRNFLDDDPNKQFSDRVDDLEFPSDTENRVPVSERKSSSRTKPHQHTNVLSENRVKPQPRASSTKLSPDIEPKLRTSILFPGQGSQFVGMGRQLLSYPKVEKLYDQASSILGYDLLNLCLLGPKSKLDLTVYCQPAVFVTSIAALEKLRAENPGVIENCVSTAGFSVGEYASLVLAGCMSFIDALSVVKVRAEAMQRETEEAPSGMMTVFLAPNTRLKLACEAAKEYCRRKKGIREPVCNVANYLFTECKVIAGHTEALDFIVENKAEFGIRQLKRLPVSGAFHTELMRGAREDVKEKLKMIPVSPPTMTVYANLTAEEYHAEVDMKETLLRQIYKPVKWEQTMHAMFERRKGQFFPNIYELGPGKQLGIMLKKLNAKAHQTYTHVDV